MDAKIKIVCGIVAAGVVIALGYSLLNNRKAISCAMEDTTYQTKPDEDVKWETGQTSKYKSDFIIDYAIGNRAKVTQVWRGLKLQSKGMIGVATDDEIKFHHMQAGCQGNELTLYRKTLLIKGESRCDYALGGTMKTYTSGECKRIKVPHIKEDANQI